jgi:hypothetical protein
VAKCWARIFENTPVVGKPQKKIVRKIIIYFYYGFITPPILMVF